MMIMLMGSLCASIVLTFIIQTDFDDVSNDNDSDHADSEDDYVNYDDSDSDEDYFYYVDYDHDYGQFVLQVLCQHLLFKLHSGSPSVMVVTIIMIIVKICSFYLSFTYVYNRFSHN